MTMDFNDATGKQRSTDLIPNGTVAVLQIKVRPGNAGEGGWLKRSADGNSEALDTELTVIGGPHNGRKLWLLLTLGGTTEGHAKAAEISRIKLCAILECARGIRPGDESETARQGRHADSYGDFNGLRFIAKIGIEKGKAKPDGSLFPDKNVVLEIITPDRKNWEKVDQPPSQPSSPASGVLVTPPPASNGGETVQRPVWSR
jgi:hypothetical protein